MSSALPPDSPMDASWAEPADTNSQASEFGPERYTNPAGQFGEDPSPSHASSFVRADPLDDQVDDWPMETCDDPYPADAMTAVSSIADEIRSGGYTHTTRPVGQGTPAPTRTPGTRGLTPEAR